MKVLGLVTAALVFVSGTEVSRANIGDSEAQCIAKYGDEFDLQDSFGYDVVGDKAASFHFKTPQGAFVIKVIFFNGVDSLEAFSNADDSRGLSEDQMKAILDLESAGQKWEKQKSAYHTDGSNTTYQTEDWLRSDGATARIWVSGKADSENASGEIELSTKEYAYAQRELDKRDGGAP